MIQTLLGVKNFRKGMDLYFARHDGEAATVEQFVQCFADASGVDLSQLMLWYSQAGTPEVVVSGSHDARTQDLPDGDRADRAADAGPAHQGADADPARGRPRRARRHAICRSSLPAATRVERGILSLRKSSEAFVFEDIAEPPVMSLNRNFSAPVRVVANLSGDDLRFLAAHDSDPFNRWQAVQSLATRLLVDNVAAIRSGGAHAPRRRPARRARGDPRRRIARTRVRRARADAAERGRHRARDRPRRRSRRDLHGALRVARAIGQHLAAALQDRYRQRSPTPAPTGRTPPAPDAARCATPASISWSRRARRARSRCAAQQYRDADNMTDRMAALTALSLLRRAGTRRRARRLLRALPGQRAGRRQMAVAAGLDPGARDARRASRR